MFRNFFKFCFFFCDFREKMLVFHVGGELKQSQWCYVV